VKRGALVNVPRAGSPGSAWFVDRALISLEVNVLCAHYFIHSIKDLLGINSAEYSADETFHGSVN
jgi:hypothetical protein